MRSERRKTGIESDECDVLLDPADDIEDDIVEWKTQKRDSSAANDVLLDPADYIEDDIVEWKTKKRDGSAAKAAAHGGKDKGLDQEEEEEEESTNDSTLVEADQNSESTEVAILSNIENPPAVVVSPNEETASRKRPNVSVSEFEIAAQKSRNNNIVPVESSLRDGRGNIWSAYDRESIANVSESVVKLEQRLVNETKPLLLTRPEYSKAKYRAFVFVVHPKHGIVLLFCNRKRDKGPHYQVVGGHIDENEFLWATARGCLDAHEQVLCSAKIGAARELWEETGVDVRDKLDRMEPMHMRQEILTSETGKFVLTCEHKKRLFFFLKVTDADFCGDIEGGEGPMCNDGAYLRLKLSDEHHGWIFEKDLEAAAMAIEKHSGGHNSEALRLAMEYDPNELSGFFRDDDEKIDEKKNSANNNGPKMPAIISREVVHYVPTNDKIDFVEEAMMDEIVDVEVYNKDDESITDDDSENSREPVDLLPPSAPVRIFACFEFCIKWQGKQEPLKARHWCG